MLKGKKKKRRPWSKVDDGFSFKDANQSLVDFNIPEENLDNVQFDIATKPMLEKAKSKTTKKPMNIVVSAPTSIGRVVVLTEKDASCPLSEPEVDTLAAQCYLKGYTFSDTSSTVAPNANIANYIHHVYKADNADPIIKYPSKQVLKQNYCKQNASTEFPLRKHYENQTSEVQPTDTSLNSDLNNLINSIPQDSKKECVKPIKHKKKVKIKYSPRNHKQSPKARERSRMFQLRKKRRKSYEQVLNQQDNDWMTNQTNTAWGNYPANFEIQGCLKGPLETMDSGDISGDLSIADDGQINRVPCPKTEDLKLTIIKPCKEGMWGTKWGKRKPRWRRNRRRKKGITDILKIASQTEDIQHHNSVCPSMLNTVQDFNSNPTFANFHGHPQAAYETKKGFHGKPRSYQKSIVHNTQYCHNIIKTTKKVQKKLVPYQHTTLPEVVKVKNKFYTSPAKIFTAPTNMGPANLGTRLESMALSSASIGSKSNNWKSDESNLANQVNTVPQGMAARKIKNDYTNEKVLKARTQKAKGYYKLLSNPRMKGDITKIKKQLKKRETALNMNPDNSYFYEGMSSLGCRTLNLHVYGNAPPEPIQGDVQGLTNLETGFNPQIKGTKGPRKRRKNSRKKLLNQLQSQDHHRDPHWTMAYEEEADDESEHEINHIGIEPQKPKKDPNLIKVRRPRKMKQDQSINCNQFIAKNTQKKAKRNQTRVMRKVKRDSCNIHRMLNPSTNNKPRKTTVQLTNESSDVQFKIPVSCETSPMLSRNGVHCIKTKEMEQKATSKSASEITRNKSLDTQRENNFQGLPVRSQRRRKLTYTGPSQSALLADTRLGMHACTLWSSENRRHYQLKNPTASGEILDRIMRDGWGRLTIKEQLQYYKRAFYVTTENSKHSTTTGQPRKGNVKRNTLTSSSEKVSFYDLDPQQQDTILHKELLHFQRVLSTYQYDRFMQEFITSFRKTLRGVRKRRHSGKLEERQSTASGKQNNQMNISRWLMYTQMERYAGFVTEVETHRKFLVYKKFMYRYEDLLHRLIAGEHVDFNQAVISKELSLVFDAITSLEAREKRQSPKFTPMIKVENDTNDSRLNYICNCVGHDEKRVVDNITEELKLNSTSGSTQIVLGEKEVIIPRVSITSTLNDRLLLELDAQVPIPVLDPTDLEDYFAKVEENIEAHEEGEGQLEISLDAAWSATYRCMQGVEKCCHLDSPSCILSCLLVDQIISRQNNLKMQCKTTTTN